MNRFLFLCIFLVSTFLIAGCNFFRPSSENSEFSVVSAGEVAENARLNLAFEFPEQNGLASIRASGGVATVTAVLNVVMNGRVSRIRREVPVVNGAANVSFASLPQGSTLGEFYIQGGHLGGFSDFHGAADLGEGENTMVASPIGSGLDSDILATVMQEVIQTTTIVQARSANLVSLVSVLVDEIKQQGSTEVAAADVF